MESILLEIVVIFSLKVNGLFSMSELAVVSARRIRLQHPEERGSRGAQAALDLRAAFSLGCRSEFTLVGILAGALGGVGGRNRSRCLRGIRAVYSCHLSLARCGFWVSKQ